MTGNARNKDTANKTKATQVKARNTDTANKTDTANTTKATKERQETQIQLSFCCVTTNATQERLGFPVKHRYS